MKATHWRKDFSGFTVSDGKERVHHGRAEAWALELEAKSLHLNFKQEVERVNWQRCVSLKH